MKAAGKLYGWESGTRAELGLTVLRSFERLLER